LTADIMRAVTAQAVVALDADGAMAQSHGAVTIEVANDGPVILAGERTRIFGPFERGAAGTARDEGGAGLGLYLARLLAQELGAELCLRSEVHHRDTIFRHRVSPAGRVISRPRHR
jgi:signal transduction histidine kinase